MPAPPQSRGPADQQHTVPGPAPRIRRDCHATAWWHGSGVPSQPDAARTAVGRVGLLHYLREQAVSRATHRYGDVL